MFDDEKFNFAVLFRDLRELFFGIIVSVSFETSVLSLVELISVLRFSNVISVSLWEMKLFSMVACALNSSGSVSSFSSWGPTCLQYNFARFQPVVIEAISSAYSGCLQLIYLTVYCGRGYDSLGYRNATVNWKYTENTTLICCGGALTCIEYLEESIEKWHILSVSFAMRIKLR